MSQLFLVKVAFKSLLYRRNSICISIVAIAISVFVLTGIEHIRHTAKASFNGTLSGVDLIVGPRTSDLNLLLTTVFRIGAPTHNMSWQSFKKIANHRSVNWAIPIALGDSHRGYRVVGTDKLFFEQYRFGRSHSIEFTQGSPFNQLFDVVVGSHVAQSLGYELEDKLVLSHGIAEASFQKHDAFPFSVTGILKPTGTPIDNALYVSLSGLEAIHDGTGGVDAEPESITAALIGLKSKIATFSVQRQIKNERSEALSAILPGVALTQLWQITRGLETTLKLISSMVLIASLFGLCAVLLATIRERRGEVKILRTLGAGPLSIFSLIQFEALLVSLAGVIVAIIGLIFSVNMLNDWVMFEYGIDISFDGIYTGALNIFAFVMAGTCLVASIPAVLNFRGVNKDQ